MYDFLKLIYKELFSNSLLVLLIGYLLILLLVALLLVLFTLRLHRNNEAKSRMWRSLEARWEPILMEILGQEKWPDSFSELVEEGEELFFVDFLMRYAEKLSGKSRETITELAQPYLPRLAERISGGDAEQRARAVLTLSTLAPKAYEAQIVASLHDESPLVCMLATRSLADNHAIQYTGEILDKITRFQTWSQNYLISTLVSLACENPEVLRHHLTEAERPTWVRIVILKALTELNDWQAMPLAVEFLNNDADRELQAAALQFITRLGHDGLLDLIRTKCHSPDFVIRLHAVKALAQLGNPDDHALLKELLSDTSQWIAYQAAYALRDTHSFETLMSVAHSDHPRADLAQQVLYDFHSKENLDFLCQKAEFAEQIPQWTHLLKLHKSPQKWHILVDLFLAETTASEVKLALAQNFSAELPKWIYSEILGAVLAHPDPPAYLMLALYQLQPNAALDTLKEKFQQVQNWQTRAEILELLSRYPTAQISPFFFEPI